MNIRNNIIDYLYDREYIIAMYDDCIYLFNFHYLKEFSDKRIIVTVANKTLKIDGTELSIIKITKEELLIKGKIEDIKMEYKDED